MTTKAKLLTLIITSTFFLCNSQESVSITRECSSFYPIPNQWYVISGWVKQDVPNVATYKDVEIRVSFYEDFSQITGYLISEETFGVSGKIIDGWQRIIGKFQAPINDDLSSIKIELINEDTTKDAWFDDVRVFPLNGTLKSFVYDEDTQRLMAELDENNYATYYEYDNEGGLVRVKKETERGVYTIQETRSSTTKEN